MEEGTAGGLAQIKTPAKFDTFSHVYFFGTSLLCTD